MRGPGVPFRPLPESGSLCSAVSSFAPDIIVDGLLGTGFRLRSVAEAFGLFLGESGILALSNRIPLSQQAPRMAKTRGVFVRPADLGALYYSCYFFVSDSFAVRGRL